MLVQCEVRSEVRAGERGASWPRAKVERCCRRRTRCGLTCLAAGYSHTRNRSAFSPATAMLGKLGAAPLFFGPTPTLFVMGQDMLQETFKTNSPDDCMALGPDAPCCKLQVALLQLGAR